jgi:hypothetical protein
MMHRRVLTLLIFTLFLVSGVQAQTAQTETKDDEINLDTHLYLIVGTNQDVADAKMPASLDPVIKQLRATMPFKNYRLAATLLNRVKNEGRLDLGWVGAPLASAPVPDQPPMTRSSFGVRQVRIGRNSEGQSTVQLTGFKFNAQIPVRVNAAVADNRPVAPVFNYEGTSLSTDISMREGEPVIVGTLNVGPTGDAIILVISAKRTAK